MAPLLRRVRQLGRVGEAMDFLELGHGHMGVNFGGVEPGVSEHLLDVAQVGPVFEHQRGHGVTEQMATARFADAASFDLAVNEVADTAGAHARSGAADEQVAFVGFDDDFRAGLLDVFSDPGSSALSQRQQSVLFAFALTNKLPQQSRYISIQKMKYWIGPFLGTAPGLLHKTSYVAFDPAEESLSNAGGSGQMRYKIACAKEPGLQLTRGIARSLTGVEARPKPPRKPAAH